jgi:hypothetical protein
LRIPLKEGKGAKAEETGGETEGDFMDNSNISPFLQEAYLLIEDDSKYITKSLWVLYVGGKTLFPRIFTNFRVVALRVAAQ